MHLCMGLSSDFQIFFTPKEGTWHLLSDGGRVKIGGCTKKFEGKRGVYEKFRAREGVYEKISWGTRGSLRKRTGVWWMSKVFLCAFSGCPLTIFIDFTLRGPPGYFCCVIETPKKRHVIICPSLSKVNCVFIGFNCTTTTREFHTLWQATCD